MTGWSVFDKANQSKGTVPLLQEVVPTARPTWVPSLPNCPMEGRSPTMTSGPGTSVGTLGSPPARAGRTDDRTAPCSSVVISIGYMVVAIEIPPTFEPASAGRPSLFANP